MQNARFEKALLRLIFFMPSKIFCYFLSFKLAMANKKATCYILNVAHSMTNDFPKALGTLTENIEDKVRGRNLLRIHEKVIRIH